MWCPVVKFADQQPTVNKKFSRAQLRLPELATKVVWGWRGGVGRRGCLIEITGNHCFFNGSLGVKVALVQDVLK